MTAKRNNKGKIDFTMLPVSALEEEAKVWMMGAEKYGRDNWKQLWGDDTYQVVLASMLRHTFSLLSGEKVDGESGLHHAAHIRANAAMLLEYERKQKDTKKYDNPYRFIDEEYYGIDEYGEKYGPGDWLQVSYEEVAAGYGGMKAATITATSFAEIPFEKLTDLREEYPSLKVIRKVN